jgi:L-arabinokinase
LHIEFAISHSQLAIGSVLITFYISGHGFGHAARSIQVLNALARRDPSIRLTIRTSVPEWFVRASLDGPAEIQRCEADTGVVQRDSLSIDERETALKAAAFYRDFDRRVRDETEVLRDLGTDLVIGDIPPLGFAAAHGAGLPSVALSNFTWDWIYSGLPDFDSLAPGVRRRIEQADALATLALRLPFHGGFAAMRRIEDVALIARRASYPRHETRLRLHLPGDQPIVLATFGGHGGTIPLDTAADNHSFLLVATDYEAGRRPPQHSNLRVVTADELSGAGLRYTDLLAASDVVVTKLGYGIVSECIANSVALLYAPRGRFVEQDVFVREMPAVLRCRRIDQDDLRRGRWSAAVEALLGQPEPPGTMASDGADDAAQRIVQELQDHL